MLFLAQNLDKVVQATALLGFTFALVFSRTIYTAVTSIILGAAVPAFTALTTSIYATIAAFSVLGGGFVVISALAAGVTILTGGLVALTAAAFIAEDLFVGFFNLRGLDGRKVLENFTEF